MTNIKNMAYWRAKNGMKSAGSFDGGLIGGQRSPMRQDVLNPGLPEEVKRKVSGVKHKEMEEADGKFPKHSHGPKGEMIEAPTKQMIGPRNKPNYDNFSEEQRLANEASVKGGYIPGISHDPMSYSDATDMPAPTVGGTTQEKNRKTRWSIINQKKAAEKLKKEKDSWSPAFPGADHDQKQIDELMKTKKGKDYLDMYYN
jgi:hypothetical protein